MVSSRIVPSKLAALVYLLTAKKSHEAREAQVSVAGQADHSDIITMLGNVKLYQENKSTVHFENPNQDFQLSDSGFH